MLADLSFSRLGQPVSLLQHNPITPQGSQFLQRPTPPAIPQQSAERSVAVESRVASSVESPTSSTTSTPASKSPPPPSRKPRYYSMHAPEGYVPSPPTSPYRMTQPRQSIQALSNAGSEMEGGKKEEGEKGEGEGGTSSTVQGQEHSSEVVKSSPTSTLVPLKTTSKEENTRIEGNKDSSNQTPENPESEEPSQTVTLLDETMSEVYSLEAEILSIKARVEAEKQGFEIQLAKEREEREKLEREVEELKKRLEDLEGESDEFEYAGVDSKDGESRQGGEGRGTKEQETQTSTVRAELNSDHPLSTTRRLERAQNVAQITKESASSSETIPIAPEMVRHQSREDLIKLSTSPLVKELEVVYVPGVLPSQIDVRTFKNEEVIRPRSSNRSGSNLYERKGLLDSPAGRRQASKSSSSELELLEQYKSTNEQLRQELQGARELIAELMQSWRNRVRDKTLDEGCNNEKTKVVEPWY
ncbi:hypothetical protein JCM16303_005813 [Sporobolomyces ruberrimus]